MLTFDQAQPGTQIECICASGASELTLRAVYVIHQRIDMEKWGWGITLVETKIHSQCLGYDPKRFRLPRPEALAMFHSGLAISASAISIWEYIKENSSHAD